MKLQLQQPRGGSIEEVRNNLLHEIEEIHDDMVYLANHIRDDGRKEDVAQAVTVLSSRIATLQNLVVTMLTDEQMMEIVPGWYHLKAEEGDEA